MAMIYIPLSENRKAELDIIALIQIETLWPKYTHGVPMVYGDYETHYDSTNKTLRKLRIYRTVVIQSN